MKTLLLIVLLVGPAHVFSQIESPAVQTREQAKQQQQLLKDAEKRRKQEEKERLKRPATIKIHGSADQVGALIVQYMNNANYQIAEDGKYRIVFTQEVTGFRGALVGGLSGAQGPPLRMISFAISQFADTCTVTVDLSVQIRRAFGRVDRTDMNKNKEWRADIDNLLLNLKYAVESNKPKGT